MSTLSDLLPAGSGGKQVDFVADGNINQGQTVALKTDGTVESISSTSYNNEFQNQFTTNNLGSGYTNTRNIAPVWDSSAGLLVAAALGGGNIKIFGAQESGTIGSTYSLNMGAGQSAYTVSSGGSFQGLAYHAAAERVVIMLTDGSYQNLYAYPIDVASNGTMTIGSQVTVDTGSNLEDGKLIYDPVNQRLIAVFRNNGVSKYATMSINAGSIAVNALQNIGIGTVTDTDLKYLQQTGQVGLAYLDSSNSSYPTALIGTVSGTTVSWGTAKQVASTGETPRIAQDNNGQIGFFIARVGGTNQPTEGYAGTLSGNNVTFGTGVDIYNPNGEERLGAYFDTNAKQFVVAADSDTSTYAKVWLATISGSTLSWVQNQYNMRGNSGNLFIRSTCGFFAPEAASGTGTGFFYWLDDGGGPYLGVSYARPAYTINLNENFIGIADAAISDTATGSVTIKGGIATTQLPLSAVYNNQSFSTASQDALPEEVRFKPDGTKFYILGATNDAVYQYSMSTAWDVSTASYESKSFSVQTQDTNPQGLAINADGTSFYMCGQSMSIYQYDLTTAYDASTASYASKSFSFSGQISGGVPWGIDFDSTGTKLYVIGSPGIAYQYTLSTAFDVSTASYASKSLNTTSQTSDSTSLALSSDGASLYVMSNGNDTVFKYTLSTPNDLATASYSGFNFTTTSQDTTPYGVAVKTDETQLYITGAQNDSVYQYSFSTSLTPNSVYYVQGDGTISTTSTSPAVRLGKALSSTSINLEFNS